jgi:hypothetical protein
MKNKYFFFLSWLKWLERLYIIPEISANFVLVIASENNDFLSISVEGAAHI